MKKFLIILAIAFITLIPSYGYAQPQAYSYTYNNTNLYYGYTLEYEFTGLDSSTTYTFTIQQVSNTNEPIQNYTNFIVSGVTTYSFSYAGFPSDVTAPFRVIDNFGQVLGQHFIAPLPTADWFTSAGVNTNTNKLGIAGTPYQSYNVNDYHQPINDIDAVTTRYGDYTLLHYFTANPVDKFMKLNIVGGEEIYEFSLEDFADYNCGIGWSGVCANFLNYVVLDTVGEDASGYTIGTIRPFISLTQDALFTRGADPHRTAIATGVYEYAKVDELDVFIAEGESLWIVSNVNSEYSARVNPPTVLVGRDVRARLFQNTERVWQGLFVKSLTDENEGLITDDFNVFQTEYIIPYATTNLVSETDVVVTWRGEAGLLNYGDATEFYFDTTTSYNIVLTASLQDKIEASIIDSGLDSLFGRMIVLVFIIVIGSVLLFQNDMPAITFKFLYMGVLIGAMWLDWFDLYIDILLAVLVVLIMLSLFKAGGLNEN